MNIYISLFAHVSPHSSLDDIFYSFSASANPIYCISVKQAFGNLGLLAGYDAKLIRAGLGRDSL